MKTKILIFIAFYLLCFSNVSNQNAFASNNLNLKDSISILSSPDLYNLTSNWVKEYSNENHKIRMKVSKFTAPQIGSILNSEGKLCFISNEYYSSINDESVWKMVVGMDAIVPIINSRNPFFDEISQQGISQEKLSQFIDDQNKQSWGTLLVNGQKNPIKYFIVNNESIKKGIANFLKLDWTKINGINVESGAKMILEIQNDPYAIGFCEITSILDVNNQSIVQGIGLLPIDKNGNGKIDYNEKIYQDLNTFLRGVWVGKYPKDLCKNIYSISSIKPTNNNEIAFLAWVLSNGQQFLNPNGFVDLTSGQRQASIDKLYNKEIVVKPSNSRSAIPIAVLILVALIALFFIVDITIQWVRREKNIANDANSIPLTFFDEKSILVPDGLYFDKSHTWAFMEKDGVVGIGIDDFLQHITGPITRIKMKNPGETIKKGEHFLTLIQEGKQLNITAPISGKIKAQNKKLSTNSSIINSSPYSEGWIYMIEPTNWLRDIQFLIVAKGYKEWLRMEFLHLKDFLSIIVRANYAEENQIVLQDGGEIKNGILKDLKPEIWEDFQTHFLEGSK
ncbi:MAG: hypothetical protein HOO91_19440 [Bacteroidales bacterium]|nr:hypothetical protein [Bacteroidales bacterium]